LLRFEFQVSLGVPPPTWESRKTVSEGAFLISYAWYTHEIAFWILLFENKDSPNLNGNIIEVGFGFLMGILPYESQIDPAGKASVRGDSLGDGY
jgi:hypothetical protein